MDLGLPIPVVSSSTLIEPGVFGIFRPVLLLADGIAEHLSPAQLQAVIAHELCHVRHRDNLVAAFQMLVETVFWFHPLVWWIGKRMGAERERACDEEVLRLGSEPELYAEGILRVCSLYVEAPLGCMSGVTGSDLKKRVQAILARRGEVDLSPAKKALLVSLGAASLAAPILMGMWNVQDKTSIALAPPTYVKFRGVSIERCKTGSEWGEIAFRIPDVLVANCVTTASLIYKAWLNTDVGIWRAGPGVAPEVLLSGDPMWVGAGTYRYRIDAQAESSVPPAMTGPMLQALLADRFGLKIHRATRETPLYALKETQRGAKLQAAKEGVCKGGGSAGGVNMAAPPGCFAYPIFGSRQFGLLEGRALSMEDLCRLLPAGRPVVDKTGISGRFDIHLKFATGDTPGALSPLYPPLAQVLEEQLGLKLDPITGPREFLVIDRIEKPVPE